MISRFSTRSTRSGGDGFAVSERNIQRHSRWATVTQIHRDSLHLTPAQTSQEQYLQNRPVRVRQFPRHLVMVSAIEKEEVILLFRIWNRTVFSFSLSLVCFISCHSGS